MFLKEYLKTLFLKEELVNDNKTQQITLHAKSYT